MPGLSLALIALLLAVSANIGVSTMVSSFRVTFVSFLDQRLAPELFVRVEEEKTASALEKYLLERELEVLPLLTVERPVVGQPAKLYGVRVGRTYRESLQFIGADPDVWDQVAKGEAVIVNEQLARRNNLWVSDEVDIAPGLNLPLLLLLEIMVTARTGGNGRTTFRNYILTQLRLLSVLELRIQ